MLESTKTPAATLLNSVSAANAERLEAIHARGLALGVAQNPGLEAAGELTGFVYDSSRCRSSRRRSTRAATRRTARLESPTRRQRSFSRISRRNPRTSRAPIKWMRTF